MKFKTFAEYLDELEETSSRIEITKILARLISEVDLDETDKAIYMLLGRLVPQYDELVFNIAEKLMIQVIADSCSKDANEVRQEYKNIGDLGDVAEKFSKGSRSGTEKDLDIADVYGMLYKVAEEDGEGSVEKKVKGLSELLQNLDPLSARFVARIPIGKLRLGFSDKTVLDALSWMEAGDKSRSRELEKAYFVTPDVGSLAKKVKEVGIKNASKKVRPQIGIPILPMLPQRLKSPKEMIAKMGTVAIEPKLDGLRILIHFKRGKNGFVKAYTRNLNETSWMFPELDKLSEVTNAKELILDTEAVGVEEDRKKLANFQTTMSRRRKHRIEESAKSVPISFYVFDVLLFDGENMMDKTYLQRREKLESVFNKKHNVFNVVDNEVTDKPGVIEEQEKEKVSEGLEGIIVKKVDSKYVPGRTGWRWVKMKEAEEQVGKLSDTIDCVVMGYTRGKGKRASFGLGQFLAGVRDGDSIKTITKVGTGLTDKQFKEMAKRLKGIVARKKPKNYEVHKDLEPDFWVDPELVVELAADEITKSPNHTAGFALRFPRLIRFRDDKSKDQATTLAEVKQILIS